MTTSTQYLEKPSTPGQTYPVRLAGRLDPTTSNWMWLVKIILVIPHLIVLAFLWIAAFAVTVVAFFAILFTGRYPRGMFDFCVGVLRWTWRVSLLYAGGCLRHRPLPTLQSRP